jgi:uncharacterized protein (TIGR02145 family)
LNIIVPGVILICFTILNNCKKGEDSTITEIKPPGKVTTSGVLAISSNGAVLAGYVADMGGAAWYVRGVCYDTIPDPDTPSVFSVYDPRTLFSLREKIRSTGSFIEGFNHLLPNTTYYARAFAANEAGVTYGDNINFTTDPLISDVEGRTYGTANIGTQVWLTKNLETTKYNDGKPNPLVEGFSEWRLLTSQGYYVFSWSRLPTEYDEDRDEWSETLYNWHSVNTGKLCPAGWHVPTYEEWNVFADYVGLSSNDPVNFYWIYDLNLFTANNTVMRDTIDGIKGWRDDYADLNPQWWSSIFSCYDSAWYFTMDLKKAMLSEYNKKYGLPVRCIKDN